MYIKQINCCWQTSVTYLALLVLGASFITGEAKCWTLSANCHHGNVENILDGEAWIAPQIAGTPSATRYASHGHWESGDRIAVAPSPWAFPHTTQAPLGIVDIAHCKLYGSTNTLFSALAQQNSLILTSNNIARILVYHGVRLSRISSKPEKHARFKNCNLVIDLHTYARTW